MNVPYCPIFERSAQTVEYLTRASSLCAWIQEQAVDVSWISSTQRDALVRLAHYSTRIEGNPLTLPEVEALAMGKDLNIEEHAKQEVLNYFAALRWIWRKSPNQNIEEKDLLSLHKLLTQRLLSISESGVYKSKPNAVFQGTRIIYKPPPPEAAHILTRGLLHWLNSREARIEHAVIVAAITHHRLVSIHPFTDGNGRIARVITNFILHKYKYPLIIIDYKNRRSYYKALKKADSKGEYEFIKYFIRRYLSDYKRYL